MSPEICTPRRSDGLMGEPILLTGFFPAMASQGQGPQGRDQAVAAIAPAQGGVVAHLNGGALCLFSQA